MEVTVKSPESYKRILEVKAPFDDFKDQIEKAYEKYQKRIQIPGFRKGKAPMHLVKSRYKGAIEAEVLPDIISELYQKASRDQNIKPVNQPKIDNFNYNEGQDISFNAEVEIQPQLEIKNYKGIKVVRKKVEIKKEDVENYINYIRDSQAQVSRVEREAKKDDYLVAEFQELDTTGVPLIGRKMEKREYRLGNGLFGEEFDQQLEGIKAGDQRRIRTQVPKEYPNQNLAGQEVYFSVKALEVLEKKLPELNDDLAKDLGHDNLDAFKDAAEKRLTESMESQERDRIRREIIAEIIKRNQIEFPPSMVDNYLNYLLEERKKTTPQIDTKAFLESSRPHAIFQIKEHLLVEEIARQENITVTDDDITAYIDRIAGDNQESRQRMEKYLQEPRQRDRLKNDLTVTKVMEFLESQAKIK